MVLPYSLASDIFVEDMDRAGKMPTLVVKIGKDCFAILSGTEAVDTYERTRNGKGQNLIGPSPEEESYGPGSNGKRLQR